MVNSLFVISSNGSNPVGTRIPAGLPNIWGKTQSGASYFEAVRNGALEGSNDGTRLNMVVNNSGAFANVLTFNAQNYNGIYNTKWTTVRPESMAVSYYIRF